MINFKNIYSSWLKDQVRNDCQIKLVENKKLGGLAKCYKNIFNGEPFYEAWTEKSARRVIDEYVDTNATIWTPEMKGEVIGFLIATDTIPEDQEKYITEDQNRMRYIEEIGVLKEYRGQNIASELVRKEIINSLQDDKTLLGYRTNAMRYFKKERKESFESAVERVQKEDREKRKNGERITVPELTIEEKQDFINQYISLLETRPDLDSSDSSKLFRGIGLRLGYSNNNGNYAWQEDPTGAMNDRIFPVIDLQKSGYTKTYYNKVGQR
ncbi:MAG: GNAT family N-acetyltransferase [bacterium]|nr:GNAT family N-acetyltransferase [bacterium]